MKKKRGRGEGAIYQRAEDGLWCSYLSIGYRKNGKRNRRYLYGKTKKEVQKKLMDLYSDSSKGTLIEITKTTVGDFIERWLQDTVRNSVRMSTFSRYQSIYKNHIEPFIGSLRMNKIDGPHIADFYKILERNERSARTRQLVHVILKRAMNCARQWGVINKNPCDFVVKPQTVKREIRYWDAKEIEIFLNVAKEDRFYSLFVLAVSTGMRQGELFGLKWGDINFEKSTLSVNRTAYEMNGRIIFGEPKTRRGRRCIFLPKMAIKALKDHKEKMLSKGLGSDLVFCDTIGNPLRRSNFRKRCFLKLLNESKVRKISFHDLRHSAATLLLTQGVHPKIVQERLGHSQISITLDTYSHVLPTIQKEAADKIDEAFSVASKSKSKSKY